MKPLHQHNNFKRLALAFCLSLITISSIISCKKFVEVPPPTTKLASGTVFTNNATANSAQLSIYLQMTTNGTYGESFNMAFYNGLLSDELTNYTPSNSIDAVYYKNAMLAFPYIAGPWTNAYNYIYQANAVILGLQNNSGTTLQVRQTLTGESLFVRAFWHFYLASLYGDVPLALTTDFTVTSKLARTSRLQVYQQCATDLTQAYSLLNVNYKDATDTVTTTERIRPNKATAAALLARVYLYLGDYNHNNAGDYVKAEQWADTVINNSHYSLSPLSGSNNVFTKNSTEAIWQLQVPSNLINGATGDGVRFILTSAPNNLVTISPQLLNAFEPNDNRYTQWVGSYSLGGKTWYFPYKYKYNSTTAGGIVREYVMVLRLAEQYLIRAEVEAEQNQTAQAVTDLNVIRTRAGLPAYAGASDKASLLTAILHERQIELFCEWGHRWFDLARAVNTASTVNANTVMSVVTPSKGGTWSTDGHQLLYPIPLVEIQHDPYLTQNVGY